MSKNQKPSSLIMICFTTDVELYRPMTIIRHYLINEECSNVKYKEEGVDFNHTLNSDYQFHFKYLEILSVDNPNSKCNLADSYLIFLNLEKEEIYEQMDSILNFIQNNGNSEKKIFVVGLYINSTNIKEEYNEEKVKEYLDQQKFNFEYSEINFDSTNELIKIIDFISTETIKNKKESNKNENDNNEQENGQSGSKCFIF